MTIDINKYKEAYLNEARIYVKSMNSALVELEKDPNNIKLLHNIFHSVHTLKSLAGTMRYEQSMGLCHAIEDVLDAIRHEQLPLTICTDVLFESLDQLSLINKNLSSEQDEIDSTNVINKLRMLLKDEIKPHAKQSNEQTKFEIEATEKIQSIEVKIEQLDILMNLAEELLFNQMKLESIGEQVDHPELSPSIEALGRLITELQYHVMHLRLVPITFVFNRFIRMTRDLAKYQNKEVTLQIEGAEIELDRSLINEIAESIAHLIRNAIDHGLETADIRKKLQKDPQGTIWLKVYRTKESAKIEISDDGAGIDLEKIKKIAVKKRLINDNADKATVLNTIFSGISTSGSVTEISGRGLGLSIVKSKIESIHGTLQVNSIPGKGTTFIIEIPLSLAIIKTLFVKSDNDIYAIPTEYVERLLMVETTNIKGVMKDQAIIFENINIPIIQISNLFHQKKSQFTKQPIVIISKGDIKVGLAVDQLLATKEVIIKPLNRSISDNKYFSGATLIGSGQTILILDVAYLLQLKNENTSLHGGLANAT